MLNDLKQFIDVAEKNRKYVPNTATGFRVALSIFEPELNDQEKESIQTFREHIEPIYLTVYRKNQKDLSSKTLLEYKRRILRLVNDFEQYGNDPNKMATWTPTQRLVNHGKRNGNKIQSGSNEIPLDEEKNTNAAGVTMNRFELSLRSGVKAIILTPADLTAEEAGKIKKYIEYLESVSQ